MYRYEYVTYRTGGGFWMDNSACEHREIIDEYAAKGWRYVGYLPTMFSGAVSYTHLTLPTILLV